MKFLNRLMLAAVAFAIAGMFSAAHAVEKNPFAPKTSGEVDGVVKEKGKTWVRVEIQGQQESVRFTPVWSGGLPKDGGGLDKEMLKKIRAVKAGSRVKIKWKYEERPRVLSLEVVKEKKQE